MVPSAHAQPLATRRVAPLPRAGHVVAKSTYTHKSTYTQWDVLFNREKVHQIERETDEVLLRLDRAQSQWYVDQLAAAVALILVPILYAVGIHLGLV